MWFYSTTLSTKHPSRISFLRGPSLESLDSLKNSICMVVSMRSVGVMKGSKIYCRSLLVYLPAALVNPGSAIVSVYIKGCVYHAQQVDTPTRRHSTSVSSVRQAGIALQMVPPLRRHANYASRANMHPRRDPASAYYVPPAASALTMEILITFHAHRVDTIALRVKPSVSRVLVGSMDHMRERRYVWTVHWVPSKIAQVL